MSTNYELEERRAKSFGIGVGSVVSIFTLASIAVGLWGCPQYNVYVRRLEGQAALAKSETERQVQVRDAQGRLDSSKLLAQTDIERAKGVAEANQIIGNSLKDNEAYLRWLYIESLKESKPNVIYVPTEAGLPILEAGKRQ